MSANLVTDRPTFVTHLECSISGERYEADTLQGLSRAGRPLSALVGEMRERFPSSGEINFAPADPQAVLARFALTEDLQPPKVVLDTVPAATNTNPTLRGQILDDLSGLSSPPCSH